MIICTQCAHPCADDSKFCTQCGTACQAEAPTDLRCSACQQILKPGQAFCTGCGAEQNCSGNSAARKSPVNLTKNNPISPDAAAVKIDETVRLEPELILAEPVAASAKPWIIFALVGVCLLSITGLAGWYWHSHQSTSPVPEVEQAVRPVAEETIIHADDPSLRPQTSSPPESAKNTDTPQLPPVKTEVPLPAQTRNTTEHTITTPAVGKSKPTRRTEDDDEADDFNDEADDAPDSRAVLNRAERALQQKKYNYAAELAQSVLANEPRNLRARQILIEARLPRH